MTDNLVLVTGATGQQGGATARHLLAAGWRVRALVRDAAAPAARALAGLGAELAVGDMADRASLDAAVADAYGVFSVQPAAGAGRNGTGNNDLDEVHLGRTVTEAAGAAGVRHLVYTSVAGVDRKDVSLWNTKSQIEEHLRGSGVPATVLRPVMFMENHLGPRHGVRGDFAMVRAIPATARVQLIAVTDIGAFAALAFADPDRYVGTAVEIAGDELTGAELVTALSRAAGRPIRTDPLPAEILAGAGMQGEGLVRDGSFAGWNADIPALRAAHPGLQDLRSWLGNGAAPRFRALFVDAA